MTSMVISNTRPGTNVSFYTAPVEFIDYVQTNYITPGRLAVSAVFSEDGNTANLEFNFTTEADKEAYFADPIIQEEKAKKIAYNKANGIV